MLSVRISLHNSDIQAKVEWCFFYIEPETSEKLLVRDI